MTARLTISQRLVIITTLFIVALVGILYYTIVTLEHQKSDAVVINIAGRQRMLNQMFMKELLSAAQGEVADYDGTARVWQQSLQALLDGGRVSLLGTPETVTLPATSDPVIREQLFEQGRLIDEFVKKGRAFVASAGPGATRTAALIELRRLNDRLNTVTVTAARLFSDRSQDKITDMLEREMILGLCVVLLGILLTVQVVRASSALVAEVAQRKRAEEDLRRSEAKRIEAFRQSDELKSALLSLVSHELRTPLTTIKTSVVSLLRFVNQLAEDVRVELLRGIDEEVNYLNRLVSNLLDMSRIEAGQLVPNREWHPLEELLEGAVRRVGVGLHERPLEVDVPDRLGLVHVDGVEIQSVLVNLLDNAVKYSPPGSPIRFSARRAGGEVVVSVSNEGEGIPPEEIERVFDRFHRVRSDTRRSVRGSGLGLAICKGIIAAHGGRIWMESRLAEGTTVTFSLPTGVPDPSLLDMTPVKRL